jgi:ABC-type methionine transport system ATPase subunit
MKQTFTILFIVTLMASFGVFAQPKTPYTEYMKENYPSSHQEIEAFVKSKNPNAEEKRVTFLIEYQCKALETLLQAMKEENADFNVLYRSIEKITESSASERKSMDFWTWPKTDWVEVENDYFFALDTQ